MTTDFVAGLARKHCHYHSGLADDPEECLCGIFEEIVREALKEAEKIGHEHDVMHPCTHMAGCEIAPAIAAVRLEELP